MPLADDPAGRNGDTDWTFRPPREAGNGGEPFGRPGDDRFGGRGHERFAGAESDRFAGSGGFGGERPAGPGLPDLSTLLALLESVRAAVPGEVQDGLTALLREVLLTLRALIDWQIERLDRPRAETQLEDIPLD